MAKLILGMEIAAWVLVIAAILTACVFSVLRQLKEYRLLSDKNILIPLYGARDQRIDCSMLSFEMRTILYMYVQKPILFLYRRAERDRYRLFGKKRAYGYHRVYRHYREYLAAFGEDMQNAVSELLLSGGESGIRRHRFPLYHGYEHAFERDRTVLSTMMLTKNEHILAERLDVADTYLRTVFDDMERCAAARGIRVPEREMAVPFLFMESMNRLKQTELEQLKKSYR